MALIPFKLNARGGRLPLNYQAPFSEFQSAFQHRLDLSISGDNVLIGSTGAAAPNLDVGPWLTTTGGTTKAWFYWDIIAAQYLPVKRSVQSGTYTTYLTAKPTANQTITVPNVTGTLATLIDVLIPRSTVRTDTTGWGMPTSIASVFSGTLPGSRTVTMSTPVSGQKITVVLINKGTNYIVSWAGGSSVYWMGTGLTPPVQPAAPSANTLGVGVYVFRASDVFGGTRWYGELVGQNTPAGTGTTAPVLPPTTTPVVVVGPSYGSEGNIIELGGKYYNVP